MKNPTAKELGIPQEIPIPDDKRHSYCAAYSATYQGLSDKEHAIYKGVCSCRHPYVEIIALDKLRKQVQQSHKIENGELVIGEPDEFIATSLDDY